MTTTTTTEPGTGSRATAAGTPAEPAGAFDAAVCVIGAGPAGLAVGKALTDRAIRFDWFEKGSMVGGLWQIGNDNGQVAAYQTLHLNSSRTQTQFPSYPMPADWPDYPRHTFIARYFEDFARDNGLLERITFRAEVTRVEPLPGDGPPGANGWAVTTSATGTRRYRNLIVANGHHSSPEAAPTSPARSPASPSTRTTTAIRPCSPARPSSWWGSATPAWTWRATLPSSPTGSTS